MKFALPDARRTRRISPAVAVLWWLVLALIAAVPLATVWNAAADPAWQLRLGQQLMGVSADAPRPEPLLPAIASGSLQHWIAGRAALSVPMRALLIRVNNEILFDLFGSVPGLLYFAPNVIPNRYLEEYCSRSAPELARRIDAAVRDLSEIQDYYGRRGIPFVYVITPSKAGGMPEAFGAYPCHNTLADRSGWVSGFAAALRTHGIHLVDAASALAKTQTAIPLFPTAGVHLNTLGATLVAQEIVDALNGAYPTLRLPRFDWTYQMVPYPYQFDGDLFAIMNILRTEWRSNSPVLTFRPMPPCSGPALHVAVVGDSFMTQVGEILVQNSCFSAVRHYFYLYVYLRAVERPGFEFLGTNLHAADVLPSLERTDVMIVEENESEIGATHYVPELRRILSGQ